MPWEISAAMEKAVTDGKVSFSRSGATSKNVNWLSLIVPNDANLIKNYLQEFKDNNHIPNFIENNQDSKYFQNRYDSSIEWIEKNNHAVISNGPFYLESYAPESRTIKVSAFDDESYPFKIGEWSEFENAESPIIKNIDFKDNVNKDTPLKIGIETQNSDEILYFLTSNEGKSVSSETINVVDNKVDIIIPVEKTQNLGIGANNIKIFAISYSVLKPDFYESSFFVTDKKTELPDNIIKEIEFNEDKINYEILIIPIIVIILIVILIKKKQSN
jgi:peptide/nickel transport system substrate-binding protein